jgi:hypothetical protein
MPEFRSDFDKKGLPIPQQDLSILHLEDELPPDVKALSLSSSKGGN